MEQTPTDPQALERLERRIADLERAVGELVALTGLRDTPIPPRRPAALAPPSAPLAAPPSRPAEPPSAQLPGALPVREPRVPPAPVPKRAPAATAFDLEQWVGGRGLLVVGVVALLASGGFFLKLAFDRGWIAPWLRVAGAVAAGMAVAVFGERQALRGLRRYGLALVGAGAGLAYLGIWAAAGPYALASRQAGVVLIMVLTAVVAWRAVVHHAEPLALWALLGAFMAPLFLPTPDAQAAVFLGYLAVLGFAAGMLAHRFAWRFLLDVAVAGYFLLAAPFVTDVLHTPLGLVYLAVGGAGALLVTQGRQWTEARLGALVLAWVLLLGHAGQAESEGVRWLAVAAGALLLLVEWWHQRGVTALRSVELAIEIDEDVIAFLATPVAFVALAAIAHPGMLAAWPGLAPALLALLYFGSGWRGRWAPFVAAGYALLAVLVVMQLDGTAVTAGWSVLVVALIAGDRWLDQRGGPGVAVPLAMVAAVHLVTSLVGRSDTEPAFTGRWALGLYAYIVLGALAAWSWRIRADLPRWLASGRVILWTLPAIALFTGVSFELNRFFAAQLPSWAGAELAGDLAISVYWLVYAGLAVMVGFRLDNWAVRTTGLAVAGLAAAKIALFDLSRLEALYRVGSFFVLALIALAVAYAYNRRARRAEAGGGDSPP
jgi:uncharacterized membrane protein